MLFQLQEQVEQVSPSWELQKISLLVAQRGEDGFLLGTVFEQFGTSVDGIFQGSELGGSIVEDAGTQAEGYPKNENNLV